MRVEWLGGPNDGALIELTPEVFHSGILLVLERDETDPHRQVHVPILHRGTGIPILDWNGRHDG